MIYYHYKSKRELFDEIIGNDYCRLTEKQASCLEDVNIIDFYTSSIFGLNALGSCDRQVCRLGIKVSLSFDGDRELADHMDRWEKDILPRQLRLLKRHTKAPGDETAITNTLIHLLKTMLIHIVVKDRYLSKKEIREEISMVLRDRIL